MIGSGNRQANVGQIAKNTQKLLQKHGSDITYDQLQNVTGLGAAKITELLAAFELSRRHLIDSDQPIITSTKDAVDLLEDIRNKKQEYFICLSLDGANRLIAKRTESTTYSHQRWSARTIYDRLRAWSIRSPNS